MVGTTSELETVCKEAKRDGAWYITSDDERTVQTRSHVRVKAGLTRTDTHIAIATKKYWAALGMNAPKNKWEELIGRATHYCSLLDGREDGADLNQTTDMLDMIRDCKGENAWINL